MKILFKKEYDEYKLEKKKDEDSSHHDFYFKIEDRIKEGGYEYDIICAYMPCCEYYDYKDKKCYTSKEYMDKHNKTSTDCIIGIKIGYFSGFGLNSQPASIFNDLLKYCPALNKMYIDFELNSFCDDIPQIYSIADDCRYCT